MTLPERMVARRAIKGRADVLVAKPLRDVVACPYGGEPTGFLFPSRVEARVTAALVPLPLGPFL